jgi:hypothetical protein
LAKFISSRTKYISVDYPETLLLTFESDKSIHEGISININSKNISRSDESTKIYFLDSIPVISSNKWNIIENYFKTYYPWEYRGDEKLPAKYFYSHSR